MYVDDVSQHPLQNWDDEEWLAQFKDHFVTGNWGDKLSEDEDLDEDSDLEEDSSSDGIVDLEALENNEQKDVENNDDFDEDILNQEEDHKEVEENQLSIAEQRELNRLKKIASKEKFDEEFDKKKSGETEEEDEKGKEEKDKAIWKKDEEYFEILKKKREEQVYVVNFLASVVGQEESRGIRQHASGLQRQYHGLPSRLLRPCRSQQGSCLLREEREPLPAPDSWWSLGE